MTASDVLDLGVSEKMATASRELCDLKYHLDMLSRNGIFQDFQNDWMGTSGTCAFHGATFLSRVVPFLDWESAPQAEPFNAMVDCRHVLGAAIKGKPGSIEAKEIPERIARYSKHHTHNGLLQASYWWYRPLGILVAHEGKHRVAFMRTNGDLPIAARVTPVGYPAPERLKLVEVAGDHPQYFAMLDERYLQALERPDVTRKYLSAYGVKTLHWSSLKALPDLNLVQAAIKLGQQETVDIQKLNAFKATELDEPRTQRLELHNLEGYDFEKWHYFAICLGLMATALTASIASTLTEWRPLEFGTCVLLGACTALAAAPWVMRWRKRPDHNLLAAWFSNRAPGKKTRCLG